MHAHVDLLRRGTSDRVELAFLQHAEQLRLQIERQFPDLVEKDGAFVRQGEAALALLGRPGKGPRFMTE